MVAQPGFQVMWHRDPDYDPADYDVGDMPGEGWGCVLATSEDRFNSLWAITFDGDGQPWGKPYARVVVAELALELMPD